MTTTDVVALPGLCTCGRVASEPHRCEYRPTRQLAVCPVCREFTVDLATCEHRLPEPPPLPDTAIQVPVQVKGCGHLDDDDCGCLLIDTATYAGLR